MNDINAVVAQLPRKCRAIFELLFYHGKSTSEVAVQLGISTKNVTNQKHRAIQMIRQALAKKEQLSLALGFLFQALAA